MHMDERPWVVYVDDEPINLRVFEANFKERFRLKTFQTAALALEFVIQHGPEVGVLITDQRMPEMTGVQLLEKVKHAAPDSQRMMLTAFADMQAMSDAVNLGQVTRYFGKPWSKEELARALQDALTIFELTGQISPIALTVTFELRLVDGHQGLEGAGELAHFVERFSLDRCTHHRGRGLADRAALARNLDVAHGFGSGIDVEVEHDLVTAQGIETFDLVRGGRFELAAVSGRAVVVEDDLPVEVFEAGHRVDPTSLLARQISKNFCALASASISRSTSASSLYT